jgi:hypothetical protein
MTLKLLFEENKNLFELLIPFEKWSSSNDDDILFSSNDKVKGKIVFKKNVYEVVKLPINSTDAKRKFMNLGKKKEIDCSGTQRYYTQLPIPWNEGKHSFYLFPGCDNGKKIYKNIELLVNKKDDEKVKNVELESEEEWIKEIYNDKKNIILDPIYELLKLLKIYENQHWLFSAQEVKSKVNEPPPLKVLWSSGLDGVNVWHYAYEYTTGIEYGLKCTMVVTGRQLLLHQYEMFNNDSSFEIVKSNILAIVSDEYRFRSEKAEKFIKKNISNDEIQFFKTFLDNYEKRVDEEIENRIKSEVDYRKNEEIRLKELKSSKFKVLNELDKDGNGEVDVVEGNDFSLLLKKHQKSIIEIDRTYVQQFVKVSSYLKTKKNNIQSMFNSIKDTSNKEELNDYVGILKNEIHSYSLILFNSLNMIVSLVEDDMITFYEIHDSFDKLNIFNSNWENEVSQKLTNIGNGLSNLMYSVEEMGQNISNEIGQLSYVTEESNRMLSNQLQDIDSSLQTNNLLTGIQTYQMYKINKNTKGLNN